MYDLYYNYFSKEKSNLGTKTVKLSTNINLQYLLKPMEINYNNKHDNVLKNKYMYLNYLHAG